MSLLLGKGQESETPVTLRSVWTASCLCVQLLQGCQLPGKRIVPNLLVQCLDCLLQLRVEAQTLCHIIPHLLIVPQQSLKLPAHILHQQTRDCQ